MIRKQKREKKIGLELDHATYQRLKPSFDQDFSFIFIFHLTKISSISFLPEAETREREKREKPLQFPSWFLAWFCGKSDVNPNLNRGSSQQGGSRLLEEEKVLISINLEFWGILLANLSFLHLFWCLFYICSDWS